MGFVAEQLKTLSALRGELTTANVDATTKASLIKTVDDVTGELKAYEKDVIFYRIVVSTLGVVIVLIIIAIFVLLLRKITGFDALTAIGSAAVGGLVGLLAPSPIGQR